MDQPRPRLTDAINDGITDRVNQLGHRAGCPPLTWSASTGDRWVLTGLAGGGDYSEQDVPAVLASWARSWNLTQADEPVCAGTIEYRGQVDRLRVELWGVADRGAFEREYERDRQARQRRGDQ